MGDHLKRFPNIPYEPGSKLLVLGMVIQPLIGNPYIGYIKPYYWVDDHPLLYGNNGSLDPSTYIYIYCLRSYKFDIKLSKSCHDSQAKRSHVHADEMVQNFGHLIMSM